MKLGRGTEVLLQILTLFFFILVGQSLVAQKKYTVSGSIKDARNGETLQGAYIMLQDAAKKGEVKGAISNQAGFFSITADAGIYIKGFVSFI